jgi:hypothetical protein
MTKHEAHTLQLAREQQAYDRSPQSARDLQADIVRRAARDRAAGHLPACSLSRCCAGCKWPKAA